MTRDLRVDWLAAELWFDNFPEGQRQKEWRDTLAVYARRTDADRENLGANIRHFRAKARRLLARLDSLSRRRAR